MRKIYFIFLFLLLMVNPSYSQQAFTFNPFTNDMDACINVREADGSPDNIFCGPLQVPNGSLTDNGDGTFSLATGGGSSTPGGSDTQVQFNDGGSFGGDAGLTYDKTNDNLTAGQMTIGGTLAVDTNTLYVDSTNNLVGFGTDSPNSNIHLVRPGGSASVRISSNPASDAGFILGNTTNEFLGTLNYRNSTGVMRFYDKFFIGSDGDVAVGIDPPTNRFEVDGGVVIGSNFAGIETAPTDGLAVEGRFGIGTSEPGNSLHIVDTTSTPRIQITSSGGSGQLAVESDGSVGIGSPTADKFRIFTNNTFRVTVSANGDFGVGNNIDPTSTIHADEGTGYGQLTLDGSSGGCLMLRDTDDAGWTECSVLNGTLSCTTDTDGVCDGS